METTRQTKETQIRVRLNLDGSGASQVDTGLPFLDHMLDALSRHSRFDIALRCEGDLAVDDHHTVEDCALTLGAAFKEALGDQRGIARFGASFAPLDEALVRAVIDLSGRAFCACELKLQREQLGTLATENVPHFFSSFASSAGLTLHLDEIRGENDHHRTEAAFKAFALALRQAVAPSGYDDLASTKELIEGASQ